MPKNSLDHLRRLDGLLTLILDLPPEERLAYLDTCEEDTALRNEARTLLENNAYIDPLLHAMAGHHDADSTLFNRAISSASLASVDPFGLMGKTISNYEIVDVIGQGGMGIVYKGKDIRLDRHVALKFLSPRLLADEETRERFIYEARAASILDHPHIGIIHEIGESEDHRLFIAMTLYEGETLKEKLNQGRLSIEQVLRYSTQIAEALEFSHRRGVVHRDIKPSNIIVTSEDHIKIVDFGVATFIDQPMEYESNRIMGTLGYMAPEQMKGKSTDASVDVWATGLVLHEMLTGEKPKRTFDGRVQIEFDSSSQSTSSRSLMAAQLVQIASRALQHKPADRYPSMTAMLKELRQLHPAHTSSLLQKMAAAVIMRPVAAMMLALAVALTLFSISTRFMPTAMNPSLQSIGIELLEDFSDRSVDIYLSRGVTAELMHELTQFDALKVVSLINANNLQRSAEDVAKELNLKWILRGSVVRDDNDRVHLSLHVNEVNTNRTIAVVNDYEEVEDLQALIHDAALDLIYELDIPVSSQDKQRHSIAQSIDPKAFELYLRGQFHAEMETPDHLEQAIAQFEEATLKEPGFARAYASMVVPYYLLGNKYQRLPKETAYYMAKRNAEKALTIDELLPEGHIAQGVVRELIDLDYDGAERSFKRAIELNDKEAEAHREYGLLLLRKGDIKGGLEELNHSLALYPTSVQIQRDVARAYYYNSEFDTAIEKLEDLLATQPDFVRAYKFLAFSYLEKDMYGESERAYSKAMELDRSENEIDNLSFYAEIKVRSGQMEEANAILDRMLTIREREKSGGAASLALVYIRMGRLDEALYWLRLASEESDLPPSINADPRYRPLHDSAAFRKLIDESLH